MADPADDGPFYWLASDGKRSSGSERELSTAIVNGQLAPSTLVWRAGWAEWLPANRVAELASVIPAASRETPLKPRRDSSIVAPPPTPSGQVALSPNPKLGTPSDRNATLLSATGRTQPPPPPIRARTSGAIAPPPPSTAPLPSSPKAPPTSSAPASGGLPPLNPSLAKREPKPLVPAQEAAKDTLAPSSFGQIGAPRRAQPAATVVRREPIAPVSRGRSPLPTLGEEGGIPSATATLRPPGAVPPPARGVPAVPALDSSGSFSFEKRSAVMTPIPAFGPPGGTFEAPAPARTPSAPNHPAPSAPNHAAPQLTPTPNEPAAPARALPPVASASPALDPIAAHEIEPALDSTIEVMPQVPPEARRTPVPAPPREPLRSPLNSASEDVLARALQRHSLVKIGRFAVDSRTVVMILSAVCGALVVALIGVLVSRGHGSDAAPATSAAASGTPSASAMPSAPAGCRVSVPAALIANTVERSVPPYATKVGTEPTLALSFAATKTKGVGLRLNPSTLDSIAAFDEDGKDAVRGVVPLTRTGSLAFFVDRDDSALRSAHTIDEAPPFTLGVSDDGFSRVVAGSTSLVWPLDAKVKITEPRTAAVGGFGYGVTFRRGGQAGSILLGFVGPDGAKKSELAEISNAPKLLGTPVIAGSDAGALVAFAGRDTPDAAWKIFVSLSKPGAAPSPARELVSGSGGGAISPTLSALGAGRWLVQWTEGTSGQYQVRVQSFAADLKPLGSAVLASPKGANAGQGSLAAFEGGALTLFILTTAGHDELWGATLSCQ